MRAALEPIAPRPLDPLLPGPDSRVAIGVPVRDGAAFIEMALRTLTHQTHTNLEIVISDNASTDGTGEICERFAREDSRIRYIRQPATIPANENFRFVWEQCKSPWFMWASHDDLRDENYVEFLLSGFASKPHAALAVTDTVYFEDHARRERTKDGSPPMRSTSGLSLDERHLTVVRNGAVQVYGLFRSEVLRSFRWPIMPVGHDWMILHWAVTFGDVVYVPGSTFWYYRPVVPRTGSDSRAYHWLKGPTWFSSIYFIPDVRWAIVASRELAYARGAHGLDARRWEHVPALCFLHHGGPRVWAKSFLYANAPAKVRSVWHAVRRARSI